MTYKKFRGITTEGKTVYGGCYIDGKQDYIIEDLETMTPVKEAKQLVGHTFNGIELYEGDEYIERDDGSEYVAKYLTLFPRGDIEVKEAP